MAENAINLKALSAALRQTKEERKIKSWRLVAKELHISPSTFTRIDQGGRPDVDTFAKLVNWLGIDSKQFFSASSLKKTAKEENVTAMISTYLRGSKNLTEEQAKALDDIIQAAYKHIVQEK